MPLSELERWLVLSLSADKAYEHIENLAKFGPRNIGSEGDQKSVKYLSQRLTECGLDVRTEVCHVGIFTERETKLEVIQPETRELTCMAHYRSGPTPKEGLTGELVYVNYGREEDYKGKNVKGKFVLSDIGMIHPVPKSEKAAEKGAIGCIWPHFSSGNRIAAWGLGRFGAPLPVIGVSYEDGRYLKGLLEKGSVKVSMKVDVMVERGEGKHVVGILKGKEKPDEYIFLSAHRETTHSGPGANDNGSGMSVLLELSRVLSKYSLKRSVMFMFSTAEEGGAFGLREYVEKHSEEMKKIVAAINLDMVAVGSKLRIVEEGRWPDRVIKTTPSLNELVREAVRDLGYSIDTAICPFGLADTEPLIDVGVPSTWLYKPDDPYFHTKDDTPDKINPNDLKVTADIVGVTLIRLTEK